MNILKSIRDRHNISKEEMANILNVSRQTYYKYENGEASLSVEHIKKIARCFDLDYESIINNKFTKEIEYNIVSKKEDKKDNDIRIDIPKENIEKFKQVFLYILRKVGSFPNVGQTVIYKLLYFIDFDYYEIYEEQLMGLKYIKNEYGPTPVSFAKLVREFEKENLIEEVNTKRYTYDMVKYFPLVDPDLSILSAREIKFIDEELDKYATKSATELSELSHKDMPWIGAKNREVIDYEAVFYRTADTSVREYKNDIR